jgi:argininosuccinate lyase
VLATLKGLPFAYNRDLQEVTEPLFDAVDEVSGALSALTGLMSTVEFVIERMREAAAGPQVAAVDLVEWLVERRMPFREAHELVGSLVRDSVQRGVPLAELVQAHPALGAEPLSLLEPGVAVTRRTSPGGAGPVPLSAQLERYAQRLELDSQRVAHVQERHARGTIGSKAGPGGDPARGATGGRAPRRPRAPRSGAASAKPGGSAGR